MQLCLITFLSQTAAFRFRAAAKENGVFIKIVQTPKQISFGGCSYAATCYQNDLPKLMAISKQQGIRYSRVFQQITDRNGNLRFEAMQ